MAVPNSNFLQEGHRVKSGKCGWQVVGLSGVTGGGKSTLAAKLLASLPTTVVYMSQDEYILPDHYPVHPKAPKPLTGINKDTLSSIDMTKMIADIKHILASDVADIKFTDYSEIHKRSKVIGSALCEPRPPFRGHKENVHLPSLLLLDGFLLFNHLEVPQFCDLLYFITLTKEQCLERRKRRVFTHARMNTKEYFDLCTWPQYEHHFTQMCNSIKGIHFIDGSSHPQIIYEEAFKDIMHMLNNANC